MDLSGVYPALTTPFANDGTVSFDDLQSKLRLYNGTDLAGYVAMGSTGESVLLTRQEMDGVLATVKEVAGREKKLLAGTGAESTKETIERCRRAAELGYIAALVKTPYYYKPYYKPEVLIAHYRAVADQSPIPVLLYSVPQFTGVPLDSPEIIALSEHANIIGIKDSSGNVQRIAETLEGTPANFQVLVGSAATVLPCLTIGARGAILALACALPEKCVALYHLFRSGQHDKARELQNILVRASKIIMGEMGIAGVKYVMDLRGYRGGECRLPLAPLNEKQKARVSDLLKGLEPVTAHA